MISFYYARVAYVLLLKRLMKNIKIIFVDIDWTILNHYVHEFDFESIKALNEAQKKGVFICLATARPYLSIEQTGLFNYLKPDGIVCTNGSVGFIKDKLLYSENFPNDVIKQIIKVCNKHNACLEYCDERHRYFNRRKNRYVDAYFGVFKEVVPPVKKYENENISALLLMVPESYDEKMKKELPDGLDYFRFDAHGVDIRYSKYNPHKGNGVKRVLEYLNIPKEYAMAIGDDLGDIPMFEEVGLGVTLENGKDEVKKKADYVTKSVCDSGVAFALKHFRII